MEKKPLHFCPDDCPYLSPTEKEQKEDLKQKKDGNAKRRLHICRKYKDMVWHHRYTIVNNYNDDISFRYWNEDKLVQLDECVRNGGPTED